ncbi:site-specific integrase [Paraburkholderia sp. DHOC27]|uniref:site-specific integrase n=1 Tax=Paraburkholderia sp. DHOC27 TaxID=2303330 RepID=UPI000E3E7CE3|nr:site-specific integrase [Paraburkholderia sp. DHOC27]RFU48020.1 hypothetical protein D0B32_10905 [Paraburkholderia sp. DHOC27]
MEHLTRRDARYYYRRRVPTALVDVLGGKTEITRALGTSDPAEARLRARKVDVEVDEMFALARRSLSQPQPATQPTINAPATRPSAEDEEYFRQRDEYEEQQHIATRELLHEQEASWLEIEARQARQERRLERRQEFLNDTMTKILSRVIGAAPARFPQATPLNDSPVVAGYARTATAPGKTLVDALATWQRRRNPTLASVNMMERVIELARRSGMPLSLTAITKQHVTTFLDSLNEHSRSTQRSYLSLLKALFSACVSDDLLASNPATAVKLDATKQRSVKARVPFSVDDLNAILPTLRKNDVKPSRYWLPLVSIFTGMRMMEIGQLRANDIKTEHYTDATGKRHSVEVIYATDEGDEQALKSQSSKRRIPVHPELVTLGFVEYARSLSNDARLFPELKMNKLGRITAQYSHAFSKHLRNVCKITDPRKTFHSFRHGFKNALREGGVVEDVSDALTGHSTGSVARSYGDDYWPLRPLAEAIERVRYHGLQLPN